MLLLCFLFQESLPEFLTYFRRNLVPVLDENINTVLNSSALQAGWTNNNCESINNVLKMAVDWKPQALPTLVETLREIIKGQYVDVRRALIGRGDYRYNNAVLVIH